METIFITAILGIIGLIYWLITRNLNYWEKRGVPYIKSPPVLGIMFDILFTKKTADEVFVEVYKKIDGYKFGGYFQFTLPVLVVRNPELISRVLIKDFTHFEDHPKINSGTDILSMILSNLCGDKWRNVRHKLSPTFTSSKLKMMFESMKECGDEVVKYVENEVGQDIEARDFMLRYVFNVIGSVAFGLKFNTLDKNNEQGNEFYKYATMFFEPPPSILLKAALSMSMPKLGIKVSLIEKSVDNFFRQLTNDVIKFRKTTNTKRNDFIDLMLDIQKKEKECLTNSTVPVTTNTCGNEAVESEDKERMDQFKNALLGINDSDFSEIFTDEFIVAQTFLFISGGSDTTSSALSFILYELAMNQDIQSKVYDEVHNVLSTQEYDYQAIGKMTYLEQCIYETLRIHPLLGIILRVCTRDYIIPDTDILIEKGTTVSIPVGGLHSDPQYFPEPEKFNPDRFQDMDAVPKGVFFPFGGGPRMYIAMKLAMLEMKIILATLLMNYTIVFSDKMELPLRLSKSSFMPRAGNGMRIKFKKRE